MADPVIIDGGGSTRIRYLPLTGVGDMDSLLTVGPLPPGFTPPGKHGSQHTFTAKLFTALKIVFIDPDTGEPTAIPAVGSFALAPGDKIVIASGPLTVQMDIGPAVSGNSVLTSFGPPSGPPQVAKKTEQGRPRYVIAAAPPIDSVTVTLGGVTSTPFNAATMSSSYTQVHISIDTTQSASST